MSRRVHTVRLLIIAAMARRFLRWRPQLLARAAALLLVLRLLFAVEDEVSAYRWKPVAPADLWVSVRAFWHPRLKRVCYQIIYGHAFGLAASVMNYNRRPELTQGLGSGARSVIPSASLGIK